MKMMSWSRYHLLTHSMSRVARRCHTAKKLKTLERRRAPHGAAPVGSEAPKHP